MDRQAVMEVAVFKVGDEVEYIAGTPCHTIERVGQRGTVVATAFHPWDVEVMFGGASRSVNVAAANVRRLSDGYVGPQFPKEAPKPKAACDGKADGDKQRPSLLYNGMPNALEAVIAVLDGGAKKYSKLMGKDAAHSWKEVPNGIPRYWEAFERHLQDVRKHGLNAVNTKDFGLLDIDHMITNLLFVRELMHKEQNAKV